MNWPSQVVHVMRKDIVRLRWYTLALALMLVALTVASVVWWRTLGWNPDYWADIGPFLFILVLVAVVVQEDGPSKTASLSAALPLSPSAVLVAKVGTVVLVPLGLCVTATAVAMSAVHTPSATVQTTLATLLTGSFRSIAATALIAANTRTPRVFAIAFIGFLVAPSAVLRWVEQRIVIPIPPAEFTQGWAITAALLWCVAMWLSYARGHARTTPWKHRLVIGLALAAAAFEIGIPRHRFNTELPTVAFDDAQDMRPRLTEPHWLMYGRVNDIARPAVGFSVSVDTTLTDQHVILNTKAQLRDADGVTTPVVIDRASVAQWLPPAALPGVTVRPSRWIYGDPDQRYYAIVEGVREARIRAGGATVLVQSLVRRYTARLLAEVPLADTIVTVGSRRFRVVRAAIDNGRPVVHLRWTAAPDDPPETMNREAESTFGFLLVNAERGEAFQLKRQETNPMLGPTGRPTIGHDWLLDWEARARRPEGIPGPSSAWLASARLYVYGWYPVRTYEVSFQGDVPPVVAHAPTQPFRGRGERGRGERGGRGSRTGRSGQ